MAAVALTARADNPRGLSNTAHPDGGVAGPAHPAADGGGVIDYVLGPGSIEDPEHPPPIPTPRKHAPPRSPGPQPFAAALSAGAASSMPPSPHATDGPPTTAPPVPSHDAVVALANDRGVVCTGAVVSPTLVLTARHCLPLREARFGRNPAAPALAIRIVRSYTPPLAVVDMALVELSVATSVRPLPLRRRADGELESAYVRLIGFGATDTEGRRGITTRHFVDVMVGGYGCDSAAAASGCIPGVEMVVPRNHGNDTCAGDSGGPLLESADVGLRVVAVTSRSVRGALLRCGDGGIYTRVDRMDDWLRTTIEGSKR